MGEFNSKNIHVEDQILILVDENDSFSGEYAPRHKAHTGNGLHHRAYVCIIINEQGKILLQKRKHWLWDNLWDLSAVSHTLHYNDHDESYEEAAARGLKKEMGIQGIQIQKIGGFNYFAKHNDGKSCENEYCAILFGRYSGQINPDKEVVYANRWVSQKDLLKELKNESDSFTPWIIKAFETLQLEKKIPL
jgi:isopentenyl-diphosphate delta-isomerase